MQLTPHFSLEELVLSEYGARHGIANNPNAGQLVNLRTLASGLEQVRAILNNEAMHITSAFRAPVINAAIGGSATSDHPNGFAADFICPGFGSNYLVTRAIAGSDLKFDQLILEYGWIHISFSPWMRRELLTKRSAAAPYETGLNT